MLGRRGEDALHLWARPGAAIGARIVRAGSSDGAIGPEGSESAAKSTDEAYIRGNTMADEPACRNPLTPEPRRRARRLARAHIRARRGGDGDHMSIAGADGASQRTWRAERQHDHGQGRAAERVERDGGKRRTLNARCGETDAKRWRAHRREVVGARAAMARMRQEAMRGTADPSCGLWLGCKKKGSGPPSKRDGGPLPRRREGEGQPERCWRRAA